MRTFYISTLGCKVNQYESEQIATLLRRRGLVQVHQPDQADLRIVNTCSVTIQAASKSRQAARQLTRLPILQPHCQPPGSAVEEQNGADSGHRVLIAGCWATSDKAQAANIPGVTAVLDHHDDVAEELDRLLTLWQFQDQSSPTHQSFPTQGPQPTTAACEPPPKPLEDEGRMIQAGTPARQLAIESKAREPAPVKEKLAAKHHADASGDSPEAGGQASLGGTRALPLLNQRQNAHQRAYLKVQDGCDAHCTYCIIPRLRSRVWSKPLADTVAEARQLVAAGHVELVLTGIFLGAYGQPTALRRRQPYPTGKPLAELIHSLCTQVPGLHRLRLSSLEPGDLNDELLEALRAHRQVVPHFHLPLQSGSNLLLRRMNRQYRREEYFGMVDHLRRAFDRPALTTDIIVGFPGEDEEQFQQTVEVVDRVGFIHIHAFPFSPRPGTAAARWQHEFVRGPVVNQRMELLRRRAMECSHVYRQQFVGQAVEVLVEHPQSDECADPELTHVRHGRCQWYFPVFFAGEQCRTGQRVHVRVDRVTPHRTLGTLVRVSE